MQNYIKKHIFLLFLIIPAFLLYMLIIFPSGSYLCFKEACGIYFWGVHGFDGVWHLAISNVSFNNYPFRAPTFYGANMSGYNYLFDLILHTISLIGIPVFITYFKIFPVVWFVVFVSLLITLGRKIKDTPLFVSLLLFFTFFAGSFSYFFTLFHDKTIWGSSSLLATLDIHTMSNLQFALSIPILLSILILIKDKKPDLKIIILISILNFFNLGIKFYGGAVTSFVIFIYILMNIDKKRLFQTLKNLIIFGILAVLSIIVFYDPFNSVKSGSIFTFSPLALIHTITEEPSLFYSKQLTNARYFLMTKGIGPKLILIEIFNIFAFLFFYLGVRLLGFFYVFWKIIKRKLDRFSFIILSTCLFAFILTATLIQKGQWWNVIQFFFYTIFLSTIFLAQITEVMLLGKNNILKIGVILIIILAIPTSIDIVKQYAVFPGGAYISKNELSALDFLRKQPDGVVLTSLYDPSLKAPKGPNDLYKAEDSAYVSAFTGKQSYFAGATPLTLMGIEVNNRRNQIKNRDCSILKNINYIYEVHLETSIWSFSSCRNQNIRVIYANDKVTIFKVAH